MIALRLVCGLINTLSRALGSNYQGQQRQKRPDLLCKSPILEPDATEHMVGFLPLPRSPSPQLPTTPSLSMARRKKRSASCNKYRRYYEKNKDRLREEARVRMAALRASRRAAREPAVEAEAGSADRQKPTNEVPNTAAGTSSSLYYILTDQDPMDESTNTSSDGEPSVWLFDNAHPAQPPIESNLNRIPVRPPESQSNYVEEVTHLANAWLAEWGGFDSWDTYLEVNCLIASIQGIGATEQWIRHVLEHADRGRVYAQMLDRVHEHLPDEEHVFLTAHVTKALTLLELRVDRFRTSPFNLLSGLPTPSM
ncbi:hypothetical protein BDN72DRAFT_835737 [Pluteus cervinus]|uniref:Uncharacterized protein n=1 Tax=Pluteus cervinus TaxID=181527 RepID=A0ACD3B468_9AGAR|nr:hypothetical protein BDN72DRAFT_835737 [Pluteus cervinus]